MYENMNLERGLIYGVGFTIKQGLIYGVGFTIKQGLIYGVGFTVKQGLICQLIRYSECHHSSMTRIVPKPDKAPVSNIATIAWACWPSLNAARELAHIRIPRSSHYQSPH
jgi:hypothetical protein